MLENIRRTNDDELGPEHIIEAVYGRQDLTDVTEAVMGMPTMQDFGGDYDTDYKIVIPLEVDADIPMSPFVFDVPEDPELTGDLARLAANYDVEVVDNLALLEGEAVPIEWDGGAPTPDFLLL